MNMSFPRYVWLTYGDDSAISVFEGESQCSEQVLSEASDGLLMLRSLPTSYRNVMEDSKFGSLNLHVIIG